jgi:hypothetical protein
MWINLRYDYIIAITAHKFTVDFFSTEMQKWIRLTEKPQNFELLAKKETCNIVQKITREIHYQWKEHHQIIKSQSLIDQIWVAFELRYQSSVYKIMRISTALVYLSLIM